METMSYLTLSKTEYSVKRHVIIMVKVCCYTYVSSFLQKMPGCINNISCFNVSMHAAQEHMQAMNAIQQLRAVHTICSCLLVHIAKCC